MIPSEALGAVAVLLAIAVIVRVILGWNRRETNADDQGDHEKQEGGA